MYMKRKIENKIKEKKQVKKQNSRADNSIVSGGIWPNFEPIQAVNHVILTCKNEDDPIKIKLLEWSQHFSHQYKSMGIFPDAQRQLNPQSVI